MYKIKKSLLFLVSMSLLGVHSTALAVVDEAKVQKILARTEALEKELAALKKELRQVKKEKKSVQKVIIVNKENQIAKKGAKLTERADHSDIEKIRALHYADGVPVVISPFLGLRSEFDQNDLVVNITDVNTDLRLIKERQRLYNMQVAQGLEPPHQFILELSGQVEAQAVAQKPYHGKTKGDLDLTSAEVDVAAEINRWATGFIAFNYDNSATSPRRTDNARVFVDRGFLTIGNLNASPFYFTVGQLFIPFGQYDSFALSNPLTKTLAKTKERALVLGFQQNNDAAWNGQIYTYNGSSHPGDTSSEFGINLQKKFLFDDKHNVVVGAGWTSNLAESTGLQHTFNGDGFEGFAENDESEELMHRIPAVNLNANFKLNQYDLLLEYVTAIRRFDQFDLGFNHDGAKPAALNIEGDYHFKMGEYDSSFALGYGRSWQALALDLPKHRFSATINTSFWKGTIESLEYRHDINYNNDTIAWGRSGNDGVITFTPASGHHSDMLTAQIGIYF